MEYEGFLRYIEDGNVSDDEPILGDVKEPVMLGVYPLRPESVQDDT